MPMSRNAVACSATLSGSPTMLVTSRSSGMPARRYASTFASAASCVAR